MKKSPLEKIIERQNRDRKGYDTVWSRELNCYVDVSSEQAEKEKYIKEHPTEEA